MNKVFKVGLIGCGHIAETYFRAHKYFNNFKIIKCADVKSEAAKKCAKTYRIQAVSVNELLKDKRVEIILNLTPPKVHYQIAKKSLLNGKHVYSEKPLAINLKDGKELLKISKRKKEQIKLIVKLANLIRDAFRSSDISIIMSPRTSIIWAQNIEIFEDVDTAFKLTFFNRCDESDKKVISEFYQRCFGRDLV